MAAKDDETRKARLAQALKANLARRKAQARARAETTGQSTAKDKQNQTDNDEKAPR